MGSTIRDKVAQNAGRAWSIAKANAQAATGKARQASGETKATTAGAAAGGIAATTVGSHMGIAAFGTAVSGAALLPVVVTVAVGGIAGFAAFKLYQDVKGKRAQPQAPETNRTTKAGEE